MKIIVPFKRFLSFFFFSLFFGSPVFSQINVVSDNGYTVKVDVQPVAIVTAASSCSSGYNYNVRLDYKISFSGTNIPAALWTLQGTIGCGPSANYFALPLAGGTGSVLAANAWTSKTNCSSPTVESLDCNNLSITIQGPGISYRTITAPLEAPLAIQLLSFSADAFQQGVRLKWATASEDNNDYFTIERSADGRQWAALRQIRGAGNSSLLLHYEWMDNAPLSGISYYRLRQTDFDGSSTLSTVQTIRFTPAAKGVAVYPVPNAGNVITFTGITATNTHELKLVDAGGRLLFQAKLAGTTTTLPALPAGLYLIRLTDDATGTVSDLRYLKI